MSTNEIDALLEQYLGLLDKYTALREELSVLQSSIHQNIARANFSSERGVRYGQDYYDERMQAQRLIQITPNPVPKFTLIQPAATPPSDPNVTETEVKPYSNPIKMFGILHPPPLRVAQSSALSMVEQIIPAIASTDAEMRDLEIKIRRARKYHLKAGIRSGVDDGKGGSSFITTRQ